MTAPARVDVRIPFTRFQLANGLTVLVHEDHALPVASVNLWYRVGSANEAIGRTGFAHLFEHLMFEGSAHVPPGAFDSALEAAGGINNGSTSTDRTNYWMNVPSASLEMALWLESDRMGFLLEAMTQDKLDVQRDVVKNERRQSYENRPYGLAWETLVGNLYPLGHPYHHPVIGSMEDIEAASLDDVNAFFRTYYAPNNASLAIAGDVSVDEVRRLAEHWFGAIPAGPEAPPVVAPDPTPAQDIRLVLEDRVQLPRLYLAWHSPRHYTEADAAHEVLAAVLADGKDSRLHRRLVYDEQIAQEVSAFQSGGTLGGTFEVVVTAKPGVGLQPLEAAIREELAKLANEGTQGPTPDELGRALAQTESGFVQALERLGGFGGKADRLNEYEVFTGDPGFAQQDLARFRAVTAEDVVAGARGLLSRPGVGLSVVPQGRRDLAGEAA